MKALEQQGCVVATVQQQIRPGQFPLGSLESRAAARAVALAKTRHQEFTPELARAVADPLTWLQFHTRTRDSHWREAGASEAWPNANFQLIDKNIEIAPGMYLIALVSDTPGTLEVHELSLAIRTPDGLVLVVGCSHPGVEHIVQEASAIDPHMNLLLGGLHQIQAPDPEVERIARVLHDQYKLDRIAPGHCTGEPEFAALKKSASRSRIEAHQSPNCTCQLMRSYLFRSQINLTLG